MSEYISRQAAMDAIRTKYCPSDFMDEGVIDAFAEIIQDLPSTQPEILASGQGELVQDGSRLVQDYIDRQAATHALRTMQTYKLFAGDDMLLIDQAEAMTEVMLLPSAQQWIPCSERLPEGGREILVTEKGGFIRHCEYANYGDFQEFQTVEEGLTVHDVIAWMPLPEPYKGKES